MTATETLGAPETLDTGDFCIVHDGPGIDNALAMTIHTGATSVTYYYLTDHIGTVHALANTNGVIVESYKYDAWGRVLGVYDGNGTPITESAVGNGILWQGREYSWKAGLYYFRARWYDPVTGRWLSSDPIGISGGLNQYVFCGNNPVNCRDPWGLLPGDRYATVNLAAAAALQQYNPLSIAENVEYGGTIYQNPDGTYSYTTAARGDWESVRPSMGPLLAKKPADYHTHGYDKPDCNRGEIFSPKDIRLATDASRIAYLGTPDGLIMKYDPNVKTPQSQTIGRTPTEVIRRLMPSK